MLSFVRSGRLSALPEKFSFSKILANGPTTADLPAETASEHAISGNDRTQRILPGAFRLGMCPRRPWKPLAKGLVNCSDELPVARN